MFRRVHSDRAATDPILVAATIAVSMVLLVGGTFAVRAFLGQGRNSNISNDLSQVAVAETTWMSDYNSYNGDVTSLGKNSDAAFQLSAGAAPHVYVSAGCYGAFETAPTGTTYWVASGQQTPTPVVAPWPASAPAGYPAGCSWPTQAP